ncbi:MAG: nuclear transport factor 2 family protein [Novosphingobium sp.]|nr:nuclear transport factor 2 family protein [Novosphingobium sp.]
MALACTAQAHAAGSQPIHAQDIRPFAGKSLEAQVQELADREEIRQLVAVYAQRVNHGHGIADLFTDDAVWTMREPGSDEVREIAGIDALTAAFSSFKADIGYPAPMIHNIVIAVEGDTARAISMNDLWSSADGKSYHAWGNYEDTFRRVGGKWLFSRRDMTFAHRIAVPEGKD